jgi:hypothetical protein
MRIKSGLKKRLAAEGRRKTQIKIKTELSPDLGLKRRLNGRIILARQEGKDSHCR